MSSNTHSLNSTTLPLKASSLPASSNPSPQSQVLCEKTSPRKQTISSSNLNSHSLNAQTNKTLNEFNEGQFIENNYKVNKNSENLGLKKFIGSETHETENIKCFINKESFKDGMDKTRMVERDENKIKEKENNINMKMKDKPKELVLKALNKKDSKEKDSVLIKNKEKSEEKNVNKNKDKDKTKDATKVDEKNKEKAKLTKTVKKKLEQDSPKPDTEVKQIKPTLQQMITKNLDIPIKKDNIQLTVKSNDGDNVIGDFSVVSKPQGPESTIDKKSAGSGDKTDSDDKKDGNDKNDNSNKNNNNNRDNNNDNSDNNDNNNNNNNNSLKDEKEKTNNVVIKSYTREQLLQWRDCRAARIKPPHLSKQFESSDGVWDPDLWFKAISASSLASSSSASSLNPSMTYHASFSRHKRDGYNSTRHHTATSNDPHNDIVLMPMKSFNNGCYVSNNDKKERDVIRTQGAMSGRVGSGRITVVDRFKGLSRDNDDNWGNSRNTNRMNSDRRYETGAGYKLPNYSRRNPTPQQQQQPEWFSEGPTSRLETIELRGFDDGNNEKKIEEETPKTDVIETQQDNKNDGSQTESKPPTSLSAANKHEEAAAVDNDKKPAFDFASLFNMPVLTELSGPQSSSKFKAFFSPSDSNNANTTSGNPGLPPPPPIYGHSTDKKVDPQQERVNFMNMLQRAQLMSHQAPTHPPIVTKDNKAASAKDVEAGLKALLKLSPGDSNSDQLQPSVPHVPINSNDVTGPPLPIGCKVTRLSDLEAEVTPPQKDSKAPGRPTHKDGDMQAFNKLLEYFVSNPNKGAPSQSNASDGMKLAAKPEQSLAVDTHTTVPTSLAPSPIVFCMSPPSNLRTPQPLHPSKLLSSTQSPQNSTDHLTAPAFLPTSVIRQMANDKDKKKVIDAGTNAANNVETEEQLKIKQQIFWNLFQNSQQQQQQYPFPTPQQLQMQQQQNIQLQQHQLQQQQMHQLHQQQLLQRRLLSQGFPNHPSQFSHQQNHINNLFNRCQQPTFNSIHQQQQQQLLQQQMQHFQRQQLQQLNPSGPKRAIVKGGQPSGVGDPGSRMPAGDKNLPLKEWVASMNS